MDSKNKLTPVEFTSKELEKFPVFFNFLQYSNFQNDEDETLVEIDNAYKGRRNDFYNTESFYSYSFHKSISLPIHFDQFSHEE